MEDFMKDLAPKYWPKGQRRGYCWLPPNSDAKCQLKEHSFAYFWDHFNIDFDDYVRYYLPYDTRHPHAVQQWHETLVFIYKADFLDVCKSVISIFARIKYT